MIAPVRARGKWPFLQRATAKPGKFVAISGRFALTRLLEKS
jgi:hypothetical protein